MIYDLPAHLDMAWQTIAAILALGPMLALGAVAACHMDGLL